LKLTPANIIISRTDSIGDVVLTLPLAAVLKQHFPQAKIAFIGRAYTRPVIEACKYVDAFIDKEDFLQGPVTVCGQTPDTILHVLPDAAIGIDDVELALLAAFIRRGQALDDLCSRDAGAQQLEALAAIVRVHERLGRERADAALRMRAERAGGEEARRDGDAECAAPRIARDDGPRHAPR